MPSKTVGRMPRMVVGAAVALLAVAAVGVTTAVASASTPGIDDCPANQACEWDNANYTGGMYPVNGTYSPGHCLSFTGFEGKTSSIFNNSAHAMRFFAEPGCPEGKTSLTVNAGTRVPALDASWNNKVASALILPDAKAAPAAAKKARHG